MVMDKLELEIINKGAVLQLIEQDALGIGRVRLRLRKVETGFDAFPTDLLLEGLGYVPGHRVAEIVKWLKSQFPPEKK